MLRHALRYTVVAVAATVLSQVVATTPATADGSCGTGTKFVGAASGTVWYYEPPDWWQTAIVAGTTLTATTDNYYSYVEAWDATCGIRLCQSSHGYTLTCDVSGYSGVLNVVIGTIYEFNYVNYTLTTSPNGSGTTIPAQCSDGIDNDLNGYTDYPNDPGCDGPDDTSEATTGQACSTVLGLPVCVAVVNGQVQQSVTAYAPRTYPGAPHTVYGSVDVYKFPLPTGGSVNVPCVVLRVDSGANTCQAAGGTYVDTIAVLANGTVSEPGVALDPVATVRVCRAQYTITVRRIGVEDFPAYSLC